MFRPKLLIDTMRLLHTTPALGSKKIPTPIVNVDHEFHKLIKWKRPDRLVPWDPRRTCDLEPLEKVDPTWLRLEYRPFAHIIDKLPPDHRKIFSVEFAPLKAGREVVLHNMLEKVKRHKYDDSSHEYKLTKLTWKIRCHQEDFRTDPFAQYNGYKRNRVHQQVQGRLKELDKLREIDYKRFEWLLEVLGIVYKLTPTGTKVHRKPALNVLVNLYCNELRDSKMAAYRAQLETEKVPFLKRKLETLQAIREDELSVGLSSSVDDDIRDTRKRLLEQENVQGTNMVIHPVKIQSEVITVIKKFKINY